MYLVQNQQHFETYPYQGCYENISKLWVDWGGLGQPLSCQSRKLWFCDQCGPDLTPQNEASNHGPHCWLLISI